MAIRQIRKFPDDILHKKCRPVETMYQLPNCGGLAANQVGVLKRVVVIDVGEGLYQLVNPKIIEAEGERIVVEGCMSSPDVWGKVKRPERVVVEYTTPEGEVLQKEADGLLAKCFCHELDHLDGIFFTDKVIEYVDL